MTFRSSDDESSRLPSRDGGGESKKIDKPEIDASDNETVEIPPKSGAKTGVGEEALDVADAPEVQPLKVTIRNAAKEDNDSLKQLVKETYTREQLLKPSLVLECTSPRKLPKFAILGCVVFNFTQSYLWATFAVLSFLSLRIVWTFLWIWLWPRLMIYDDNLYGGMFEKFRSLGSSENDVKSKSNVRRKRSCLLVAEAKGHGIIGCLGVAPGDSFINPTPTFFQKFAIWILDIDPPVAEFKRLMVKESFRSKGVATKLLESAFDFCLTNKYKSVTLSTFLVWDKARRLYAKVGFEESDIQMFDFSFHGKNLATTGRK